MSQAQDVIFTGQLTITTTPINLNKMDSCRLLFLYADPLNKENILFGNKDQQLIGLTPNQLVKIETSDSRLFYFKILGTKGPTAVLNWMCIGIKNV